MSNEIELYSKLQDPIQAIKQIGEMFAKSGIFGCDRQAQGEVLAMICLAEKKSPVAIVRDYDIIDGKLRKKSLASLADFRSVGGKHRWIKTGDDGKEAVIELTFEGQTITSRFTIEEAKAQGLVRPNSNWVKTPANMLRARAVSNGVAMLCPEIFAGGDEGESQAPAAPAEALLKPAKVEKVAEPTSKPERTATIIDVQATATTATSAEPTPAKESPAATSTPAPATPPSPPAEPKRFGVEDVQAKPDGRLTNETVLALQAAIGDSNAQSALDWLITHKWIKTTLDELTADRAKRIIAKPDTFLGYVKGAGK